MFGQNAEVISKQIHKKVITYFFMLVPFLAWLWSFPSNGLYLERLAIEKGVNGFNLFLYFCFAHTCGLLIYGWYTTLLTKGISQNDYLDLISKHSFFSLTGCCLSTLFSAFSASYLLPYIFVFIGFIVTPFMIDLVISLSIYFTENERGKVFCTALLISLFIVIILAASPLAHLSITHQVITLSVLPLLSIYPLYKLLNYVPEYKTNFKSKIQLSKNYWIIFTVLLFGFYTLGGLMYFMVYPNMYWDKSSYSKFATLFYLLCLIPAGILADKFGRKPIATVAICSTGLGYLMLITSSQFWINVLSSGFMQIGAATMNVFIWLTAADLAATLSAPIYLSSRILFITILSLGISAWETKFIPSSPQNSIFWAILSTGLLFILLPLLNLLNETNQSISEQTRNSNNDNIINRSTFYQQYRLTEREKEVSSLILEGYGLTEIQGQLNISPNTLKTHLRNIYRKTNTGNQKEFILLAWHQTQSN